MRSPAAESARPDDRGVEAPRVGLSSYALLRVAALPVDTLDALRLPATAARVDEVLRLEARLADARGALVAGLHAAVPCQDGNPAQRQSMLALKRDIFNGRAPRDPAAARAAVEALEDGLAGPLRRWLDDVTRWTRAAAAVRAAFGVEMVRARAALKEALRDPRLRRGLVLASPDLERELDGYLAASNESARHKDRRVERGALLYVLRAASKASPFSTLATVGRGRWVDGDTVPLDLPHVEARSVVRINIALLAELSTHVLAHASLRPHLPVQLKAGWTVRNGRVGYLRRSVKPGGPGPFATAEESLFHLPLTATLERLLDRLEDGRAARLGPLAHEIAGADVAGTARLLGRLLELNLLIVPSLQPATWTDDALPRYARALAALDHPIGVELAAHLEAVESRMALYAEAAARERRALLVEMHRHLASCFARLGATDVPPPSAVAFEDAVRTGPAVCLGRAAWDRVAESLALVQRLAPVLDRAVGLRLMLTRLFQAAHGCGGRADDVLSFAEAFAKSYYGRQRARLLADAEGKGLGDAPATAALPEVARLRELRRELAELVRREHARGRGEREIILTRASLESLAARVPGGAHARPSHSFFVQAAPLADGFRVVLNHIYGGSAQMFSRFAFACGAAGDPTLRRDLAAGLRRSQARDALVAEMGSGIASNLDRHPPLTRYQLALPDDPSAGPRARRIDLADLYIVHDEPTDSLRLRSKRLGREIVPLYAGSVLPLALSPLRQVLLTFSGFSFVETDLWAGVAVADAEEAAVFRPRIRFEDVVLQRAFWKVSMAAFPRRRTEQGAADHFLDVARWRTAHRLPARAFAVAGRVASPSRDEAFEGDDANREARGSWSRSKPLYVDFESGLSVALLERIFAGHPQSVTLTELLPGRATPWLTVAGRAHVSEVVLELGARRGGGR